MCGDQQHYSGDSEDEDEEEGPGQLSADNKEYYDKLMVTTTALSLHNLTSGYMYVHIRSNVYVYLLCPEMNSINNSVHCFCFSLKNSILE